MRTELLINRLYANMDTVRQLEADQQSDAAVFARTQKKTIGTGGSPIEKVSIPSREALYWATMGNARALCLDHLIGSLTPGKQADLILLRTDRPHMISAQDPVQAVVWYGQTSDVDTVMVAGSMVKRDGRLLRGDIGLRKAELQASAARLLQARRSALAAQARSIGAVAA